jgi:hypothetical protein
VGEFTLFFIYILQSVVFLSLGVFFLLKKIEFQHRRRIDSFLTFIFLSISFSYGVYSLTLVLQDNSLIKNLDFYTDIFLLSFSSLFACVVLGSLDILPFKSILNFYLKILTKYEKIRFKYDLKKVKK